MILTTVDITTDTETSKSSPLNEKDKRADSFHEKNIANHPVLKRILQHGRYRIIYNKLSNGDDIQQFETNISRCLNVQDSALLFPKAHTNFLGLHTQGGSHSKLFYLKDFSEWIISVADAMEWIHEQSQIHGGDFQSALYSPAFTKWVMEQKNTAALCLKKFKAIKDEHLPWLQYEDIRTFEKSLRNEDYPLRPILDLMALGKDFGDEFKKHFFNKEFLDFIRYGDEGRVKIVINRYKALDSTLKSELPLHEFWSIIKTQGPKDKNGRQTIVPFETAIEFLEIYQTLYPSFKNQLNFTDCISKMGEYNIIDKCNHVKAKQRKANAKQYKIYSALALATLVGVSVLTLGLMALPMANVTIAVGALLTLAGGGSLTGKLIINHGKKQHRQNSPLYHDVQHIKSSFFLLTKKLGHSGKQQGQPSDKFHGNGKPYLFRRAITSTIRTAGNFGHSVKRATGLR